MSLSAVLNRTTLLMSALCGQRDDETMAHALNQASYRDLEARE